MSVQFAVTGLAEFARDCFRQEMRSRVSQRGPEAALEQVSDLGVPAIECQRAEAP